MRLLSLWLPVAAAFFLFVTPAPTATPTAAPTPSVTATVTPTPTPPGQLDEDQRACVNAMNENGAKVNKAQLKEAERCLKDYQEGRTHFGVCLTADWKGKVQKAREKTVTGEDEKCHPLSVPPPFAYTNSLTVNQAAVDGALALTHAIFGNPVNNADLLTNADNRDAAECQLEMLKRANKVENSVVKEIVKAKKQAIKEPTVNSATMLEATLTTALLANNKIAKAEETLLRKKVDQKCGSLLASPATVFPGACADPDLSVVEDCVIAAARRQACLKINAFDALALDCDGDYDTVLPYPTRNDYQIKSLQPDFWPNWDEISGNGTGGVSLNLVWAHWEPVEQLAPCTDAQQEYDGHCFTIAPAVDDAIREWTRRGLVVTAIVYGVPEWAREGRVCMPPEPYYEIFCAPDDPTDYGRFSGMLAQRYNGMNGNGRIADFVIHNEVNLNDWFDIGCGQGTPCNVSQWVDTYADNYIAAYDAIMLEQSTAKVLTSFSNGFDYVFDRPAATHPTLSVKTFLENFAPQMGDRQWRVAYHPYPQPLQSPFFSADDLPFVTYGNIGVLVGWLMATFPSEPHAWEIQLTESGINSIWSESLQAIGVCNSFVNVLATPFIENYVYHRMKDHPYEVTNWLLALGLADVTGDLKPAWEVWALANRYDLTPPQLSCGFEHLPYTRLVQGYHASRGHWASTRILPNGFTEEQAFKLYRKEQPGTVMLYECKAGDDNFVSLAIDCEGQQAMGPLGYIHTEQVAGTVALYRCQQLTLPSDQFISIDSNCEGYTTESLLGYAFPDE